MCCNQDNEAHVHLINTSSSPSNFQKVINSKDKNIAARVINHIFKATE